MKYIGTTAFFIRVLKVPRLAEYCGGGPLRRVFRFPAARQRLLAQAAQNLLRSGAAIGLGLAAYWTARLAWADHLSRGRDVAARTEAVRLFPAATSLGNLAEKREESGGSPIRDLERAAALEPENPEWRLRLGLRAELAGDLPLAEASYLQAARLSRLYQPRYLLAQFYFRRGDAVRFCAWSGEAFLAAYGDVTPLLELRWRIRPDPEDLAQRAPWNRPEIALQFVLFLAGKHRTGAARALSLRLAGRATREQLAGFLDYVGRSPAEQDAESAVAVWNALCQRGLLPYGPLEPARGQSLTNGDFQRPLTEAGFDWRVERAPWLRHARSTAGLRLTLSGDQPEYCLLVSEFAPVMAGRTYLLRSTLSPAEAGADEGFHWLISGAAGQELPAVAGTGGRLAFTVPRGRQQYQVVRLGLVYQRPRGSTRLAGSLTLSGVRLEAAE